MNEISEPTLIVGLIAVVVVLLLIWAWAMEMLVKRLFKHFWEARFIMRIDLEEKEVKDDD